MAAVNTGAAKADDPENNAARDERSAAATGDDSLSLEEQRQCRIAELQAKIEDGVYPVDSLALSKSLIEKHLKR